MTEAHEFDRDYYAANGQLGDRPALRWYAALAKRYLGEGPILDVGCGTGYLLRRLAEQSNADGIEVSEFSARLAGENSPSSSVYLRADDLPLDAYDRFISVHVIEHLDDDSLRALLARLAQSARRKARWLIVTPDLGGRANRLHGDRWNAFTDPTHINLKSADEWATFFTQEGFAVVRAAGDGLWNNPYSRLPGPLDRIRFSLPMAVQFLSRRMFLPPGSGESILFVLERDDDEDAQSIRRTRPSP